MSAGDQVGSMTTLMAITIVPNTSLNHSIVVVIEVAIVVVTEALEVVSSNSTKNVNSHLHSKEVASKCNTSRSQAKTFNKHKAVDRQVYSYRIYQQS
jgi:hypothetical protein